MELQTSGLINEHTKFNINDTILKGHEICIQLAQLNIDSKLVIQI